MARFPSQSPLVREACARGEDPRPRIRTSRHTQHQEGRGLLTDFPPLVVLNDISSAAASPSQIELMLQRAVERSPGDTASAFLGVGEYVLSKARGGHTVRDVLRTNAFSVDLEGMRHLAVFLRHSVSVI